MSDLHVTSNELASVAGELDSVADGVRSGLRALDAEVSGLLGSGWSGEAASAFDGVWREWHDGAGELVDGLTRMAGLLNDAAARYDASDASGAANASRSGL